MRAHPDRIDKGLYWDRSLTLVAGCTPVSPACENCWSATEAHMRAGHPHPEMRARGEGLTCKGRFNGNIRLMEQNLEVPGRVKTSKVWAVWNDLFHEDVPMDYQARAFDMMRQNKQHLFIMLTKRPERLFEFCVRCKMTLETGMETWPKNIWPGITAENQECFDKRWPYLHSIPAPYLMISYEPALGPLELPHSFLSLEDTGIVVCGGESGKGARPMHPDWARSILAQCQKHGVHFFFKQWGEWTAEFPQGLNLANRAMTFEHGATFYRVGKKLAGRHLDGREWSGWPGKEA